MTSRRKSSVVIAEDGKAHGHDHELHSRYAAPETKHSDEGDVNDGARHSQQLSGDATANNTNNSNEEGAVAALVAATERDYTRSKWTLLFTDSVVEAEYVRFMYVDGGAYGPKMYAFSTLAIWLLVMLWFHHPDPAPAAVTHTWYHGVWLLTGISIGINFVTFLLFFVPALAEYREWIFFTLMATHWPAFASGAMLEWHKESAGRMPLVYMTGCLPFCALVALARFVYTLTTVGLGTTTTLAVVSFLAENGTYFETHSYFEIWLWVLPFFSMGLLPVFERRSRDAFVETQRAKAAVELVDHQVASMRFAVAALFPPTPTLLALAQRRRDQTTSETGRPSSLADDDVTTLVPVAASPPPLLLLGPGAFVMEHTCMVQTDIAGFTAFASQASMAEVVGTVGQVFTVMDAAAAAHGVEKVHTVGDCFVGAVFAPAAAAAAVRTLGEATTTRVPEPSLAQRALATMQFALAAKDATAHDSQVMTISRGASLKIRVGVHVGTVVAALVGAVPPKCDLFDLPGSGNAATPESATVTHTAHMEASGRPGYVHASTAFVAALRPVATAPLDDDDSEDNRTPDGLQLRMINMRLTGDDDTFLGTDSDSDGRHEGGDRDDEVPGTEGTAQRRLHGHVSASDAAAGAVVALLEDVVAANAPDVADMLIERTTTSNSSGSGGSGGGGGRGGAQQQTRSVAGSPTALENKAGGAANNADDEMAEESATALNIFKLRFKNDATEAAYVEWLRGTSVLRSAQTVQLLQSVVYLVAEMGLAPCTSNVTDRCHVMLAVTGLLLVSAIVHGELLAPRYFMLAIPPIYGVIAISAALMLSTTCLPVTNGVDDDNSSYVRYQRSYIGTLVIFWYVQCTMALPLCVDQPMLLRLGLLAFISLVIAPLSFLLRDVVVGDGALALHAIFVAMLFAFMAASYFADLSLRRGFAATTDMRTLLTSQRGKLAATVAKAADVMLPPFVNRAIAQAKARSDAEAANDDGRHRQQRDVDDDDEQALLAAEEKAGQSTRESDPSTPSSPVMASSSSLRESTGTSATTRGGDKNHSTSMNVALEAASKVAAHRWHFGFPLPVCFVTFEPVANEARSPALPPSSSAELPPSAATASDGDGFHEVALIALAEAAAKRCNEAQGMRNGGIGVHKVKSIGRRVLFVAGLDAATRHADAKGECARPPGEHTLGDAVAALVDVALSLSASARSPSGAVAEAVGGPGRVKVTAGVHCGPCFGAVLGLKRAVFDVFGDGVNTASRMESTATRGTVQLSEAAAQIAAERTAVSARRKSSAVGTGWTVEAAGTVEAKGKGTMPRFVVATTTARGGGSGSSSSGMRTA